MLTHIYGKHLKFKTILLSFLYFAEGIYCKVSGKLNMHWELRASGCEGAFVSDEAQTWIALTPTAALCCGKNILFTEMIEKKTFMDIYGQITVVWCGF